MTGVGNAPTNKKGKSSRCQAASSVGLVSEVTGVDKVPTNSKGKSAEYHTHEGESLFFRWLDWMRHPLRMKEYLQDARQIQEEEDLQYNTKKVFFHWENQSNF